MKSLFYITATVMAFFVISSAALAQFSGGLGTPDNPWQIANADDLLYLAEHTDYYDACFILTADIDLSPAITGRPVLTAALIASDTDTSTFGFQGAAFAGVFDGENHTISNLTIDTAGASNDYLGLFGKIDGDIAEVKNLRLESVLITGGNGSTHLGGLCGWNGAGNSINNCYATGSVYAEDYSYYLGGLCGYNNSNCYINNCYTAGSVNGNGNGPHNLGGMCGWNSGYITNCSSAVSVTGGSSSRELGGLCGFNAGEINTCFSTGSIINGVNSMNLGGLCGKNSYGDIISCYSTGKVSGGENSDILGGLCGYNEAGVIINSYASGDVVGGGDDSYDFGGLCGYNGSGIINNCYATGSVSGISSSSYIGGLCGYNNSGSINNCFWDIQTSGVTTSSGGTGKTTAEMQTMSTFTDSGWDFSEVDGDPADWWMLDYPKLIWQNHITFSELPVLSLSPGTAGYLQFEIFSLKEEILNWTISGHENCAWITSVLPMNGISIGPLDTTTVAIYIDAASLTTGIYTSDLVLTDDYGSVPIPLILIVSPLDGTGTEAAPFLIQSFADFQVFADPGNYAIYWADGVHTRLEVNLDLDSALPGRQVYTYAPIAPDTDNATAWYQGNSYKGVFDGNGYRIVNLTIDTAGIGKDYLGLFGFLENTATVENLGIEGVTITCGDGSDLLAGLCGVNYGSIISCCVNGSITSGSNSTRIGGLSGVSHEQSKIAYCYTNIDLTSDDTTQYLGGLCGKAYHAEILNSYAAGTVFAGIGSSYVGGFCGQYDSGNIAGNFWDTTSSGMVDPEAGQPDTDGLIGKTTAEMQQMSTFAGNPANWDFVDETINGVEDHWRMCVDGVDYPRLRWEFTTGDLSCPDGVDLVDVAVMAANWLESDCITNPAACGYADLDGLGTVDIADLAIMAEHWLEGI